MSRIKTEKKINKYIANVPSDWIKQIEYYEKNRYWLDKSCEIAVRILAL